MGRRKLRKDHTRNFMMNFLKRFHLFEILLITVILSIHLYAAMSDAYNLPNTWFTRDDAYYYFKVAQNITEGKGSTFDGINLTNGYHPLWMVVCIPIFALARFDLILPMRVLLMVMAIFNAATAILIYRLVKSNLSHTTALMAASFWAFNLYIHFTVYEFGLETPLAAFAIVLFMSKLSQFEKSWRTSPVTTNQLGTLALTAVLVMLSRLDLIFLAVIGGTWIVFHGKAIRYFLPLDMVIIFLSMTASIVLRTNLEVYNTQYAASAVEAVLIALVTKTLALYFMGAYQHPRAQTVWRTIRQTVLALAISAALNTGLYIVLSQLGLGKNFPRSAFAIDFVISTILILAVRLAAYWFGASQEKAAQQSPITEFQTNWKKWLGEGSVYYGIVGGALALYMLYNKLAFGTSSPVSGQIKRWWGTLGKTVYDNPPTNWTSFLGINYKGVYDAWQPTSNFFEWAAIKIKPMYPGSDTTDERYYIVMAVSAIVVLVLFFLNAKRVKEKITNLALIPLMGASAIQLLSYTATAYGGAKEWYWVSQLVLIVLVESILLDIVIKPFQKHKNVRIAFQFAAIATGVYLATAQAGQVKTLMLYNYFEPDRPFMEVLPYLEENTPPGAVIGMTGGGNVGYFIHDRTIVNMDGLINSYDYFRSIQNGEAPIYLQQHNMQIVFANPRLLSLPPYYGQFDRYLESYDSYGGKSLMYLLDEPK